MATDTQDKVLSRRRAQSVWTGDIQEGSAQLAFQTSGAIPEQRIALHNRISQTGEKQTDPEELLAGSHAACYSMSLSGALTRAGTPPQELTVQAVVELRQRGEHFVIGSSKLTVRGRVPGIDQGTFAQAAAQADEGCPISNLIRATAEVTVEATLES